MHTLLRYLVLLVIGFALAFACTWVVGWLAALAWDPQTYRSISSSPVLSFAVLTLGMAALPVGILALAAGTGISRRIHVRSPLHLTLLTAPWAVTLLAPPPGVELSASLSSITDPHALTVLVALPLGLLVGAFVSSTRNRARAAAA